jgi:hypothetical protein
VLGRASQWPAEGTEHYDRAAEYYFGNQGQLEAFLRSPQLQDVLGLTRRFAEKTLAIAVEPQHVFFTTTGHQPIPPALLQLTGEAGK